MKKVLLIGPYGLGNLIMAAPAIKALHKTGGFQLDILCLLGSTKAVCEEIAPLKQSLNRIHFLALSSSFKAIISGIMKLRREKYDYSVVLFPSAKIHYNLLSFLIGAKVRVGSRYEHQPVTQGAFLNTLPIPVVKGLHDVEQNIEMLNKGLGLRLNTATDYILENPPKQANLIGIHAGCKQGDTHKRWKPEQFLETMGLLFDKRPNLTFRLFFGPDEQAEKERFQELLRTDRFEKLESAMEWPEKLSIRELFDRIGECACFLSNDSGLMHIAASLGVAAAGIFGPSDERRTGPFSPCCKALSVDIDCRPCTHTNDAREFQFHCVHNRQICMEDLSPETVSHWLSQFFDNASS